MRIGWNFPSSNGGVFDGFNDAGIETYAGARYNGLAREIIQNSLDAVATPDGKVTVEFEAVKIPRDKFPHADELLSAMQQCLGGSESNSNNPKEKVFFDNAVKAMSAPDVLCLKISDFGTTGMRGDYRRQRGQWHSITKARGSSDKRDDTAGGSFGIGKHASFAVSSLRTVFYGTRYENENGETIKRAQGKSILMSHNTGSGDYTSGTGFWGKIDGCLPMEGDDVPVILQHSEQGSIVFIAGFDAEKKWQHRITATVLSNFFYAIDRGMLEVLIQDDAGEIIEISASTLKKCFSDIMKMQIDEWEVSNSHCYYRAIKEVSGEGHKESQRTHLGHCRMWVLKEEGLPKRVALLRKTGMLITDEQQKIKMWPGRLDFAGVFLCDSDKGNFLLRAMENPRHDAFELDRATPDNREECKKALKDLVNFVKECVDELAKPEGTGTDAAEELKTLLPDTDQSEQEPGNDGEERDIEGAPLYAPKPLKTPKPPIDDGEDEDEDGDEGGDGTGGDTGGDNSGDGEGEGAGTGGTGERGATFRPVKMRNVRVVPDAENACKKKVYFTPLESGRINVSLLFAEDDGILRAGNRIKIATPEKGGGVFAYSVEVHVQKDKRAELSVTLSEDVSDSIAVTANIKIHKESGDENSSE